MKVYKLKHKEYNGELVFGLPYPYNESPGEIYVNELLKNMKPWNHCVPYYRNSHFAFVSLNAVLSFLFISSIELTIDIYNDLNDKFYVESFDLSVWSDGLSKYLCTYFDDEINEDTNKQKYNIEELNSFNRNYVTQDPIADADISLCKERYYKNVKTFY